MDESVEEQVGLSDQYTRSSPWPVFVALGLVVGELGVLFGLPSLTVGGALLLAGSVVGILRESGYAETLWAPTAAVGGVYGALGGGLLLWTSAAFRGAWLAGSGAALLALAGALALYEAGYL